MTLPPGADLAWTLYGHGQGAVDEAAGSGLLSAVELSVLGGLHIGLPPSGTLATGPTRNLTLAP
ncbi:MAG: hypothetical protein O3A02_02400 [bacterium]|nr:hypothetical protein [bacterium]